MRKSILVVVMVLFGLTSTSLATTASFQGLGDLPTGQFQSYAFGISGDGSVVVGSSRLAIILPGPPYQGQQAFRWEASTGMQALGDHPTGDADSTEAYAASSNGSVLVGDIGMYGPSEAFRWTAESGMTSLGFLEGGDRSSSRGVSSDGSVVVGWSKGPSGAEAFRWTNDDGMIGLGYLPLAKNNYSYAYGVSNDGSVVVGRGVGQNSMEAFRWTESSGMVGLGFLSGAASYASSYAFGVSADGSTVVGKFYLGDDNTTEAFVWTESDGMVGLGHLPGGNHYSTAWAVSADGSIIVGSSITDTDYYEAFIWDEIHGMRNLKNVLVNEYRLDLNSWTLYEATAISHDGLTIVGYGRNPNRHEEGWIVTLPGPVTLQVAIDIKPQSCPNPLNVKSKGVLPVAILGTEDVNVIDIVIASIRLADPNVAPIRNNYEDVAAPVSGSNDCNCITDGPDGFLDLTLKFETQRIVEAIGEVNDGDVLELELTGVLFDETPIEGADCILISGRHKPFNKADINKDGVVDTVDFAIFAQNWLQSSIIDD